MGRAIELSLLAIIVIVVAFYVIPKVMLELSKMRGKRPRSSNGNATKGRNDVR